MKLSICIPVFNFDVSALINALKTEIAIQNLDGEIILIDDASEPKFRQLNSSLKSENIYYHQLETNIGRSKIRNRFLKYSSSELFLFLDCDCKITSARFISNYLYYIREHDASEVIFGGRSVEKQAPEKNYLLRWTYAIERENLPMEKRIENPHLSFQTNNFLISREVFAQNNFDENFNKYGYEDLLFGLSLKANSIDIQHIENPVLNIDLESNEAYLKKVEESISSLAEMMQDSSSKEKIRNVKLVRAWHFLNKSGLRPLFLFYFKYKKKKLRNHLLIGDASLRKLDIYKLGLLCKIF